MAESTFVAVRDSLMNATFPTTNYGGINKVQHGVLYAGGAKTLLERGIGDFDLSSLGAVTVLHAELVRYIVEVFGAGGFGVEIRRCTRPGTWVENEVTWNNYKAGTPWTVAGGDFSETDPPFVSYTEALASEIGTFTVTGLGQLVQDAIDKRAGILSIITRIADENPVEDQTVNWWSRESNLVADRWRVVVTYGSATVAPAERRDPYVPGRGERGAARPGRPAIPSGGMRPAAPAAPVRGLLTRSVVQQPRVRSAGGVS